MWVANYELNDELITSSLYVKPSISKQKATFWQRIFSLLKVVFRLAAATLVHIRDAENPNSLKLFYWYLGQMLVDLIFFESV